LLIFNLFIHPYIFSVPLYGVVFFFMVYAPFSLFFFYSSEIRVCEKGMVYTIFVLYTRLTKPIPRYQGKESAKIIGNWENLLQIIQHL